MNLDTLFHGEVQRFSEPVLSSATGDDWSSVTLYSPCVIKAKGMYRMWFIGGNSNSREMDHSLGYAESEDGLEWKAVGGSAIASPKDIPWGMNWNTPDVHFDEKEDIYRMWFSSVTDYQYDEDDKGNRRCTEMNAGLGYAVSKDGIHWDIHPESICTSGRSPSVLRNEGGGYTMWMGSRISPSEHFTSLHKNVYRVTSEDGLEWTRGNTPVVTPTGKITTCIYPCVVRRDGRYVMIFGAYQKDGKHFDLYCATSDDGEQWKVFGDEPVLPASRIEGQFDGRYTSTPSLVCEEDRILLYYSARSFEDSYTDGKGVSRVDTTGVYSSIGVAVIRLK